MRTPFAALALALFLAAAAARTAAGDELPTSLEGWLRRQQVQESRGESAKAEAEARARLEKEPRSAEALYLLGRVLGNSGKVEEARVQFEAALEVDPHFWRGWWGMARVHESRKDFETALREARRAHELAPSPETRHLLVQILYRKGDRPGAYRFLQDELAGHPADHDLRCQYAILLQQDGLLGQAEKELRAVLAAEPGHPLARQALVKILRESSRLDAALEACREGMRLAPKDVGIRVLYEALLIEKENFEGAAAVLEEILGFELTPEFRKNVEGDLRELRRRAALPRAPKIPTPREVVDNLKSPDAEKRRESLRFILGIPPLGYVPTEIAGCFTDEDETVRILAMRVLGRHAGPGAAVVLDEILFGARQRETAPAVRVHAVRALGSLRSPVVLPSLIHALEEPDPEAVRAAVEGIAEVTGKSFVDFPGEPIPDADLPALRGKYVLWWLRSDAGKFQRRKAAEAVGRERLLYLGWYVVPWILEDDPAMRAAVLDCVARLTVDESWRSEDASTPEARVALRDRAFQALGEKR